MQGACGGDAYTEIEKRLGAVKERAGGVEDRGGEDRAERLGD